MSGFPIRMLNGVGVVVSKKRNIKIGKEFDSYFPKPTYKDPILFQNGENEKTIDVIIPKIVNQYLNDTKKIADVLKQETKEATSKRIFDFIYTHIQYKIDEPHEEQVRRPARSWADRVSGVDCDCYTTFISSILTNLRIPHFLRMSAYSKDRGFQHIYVIVPKNSDLKVANRSDYWAIDPVLDAFNDEKPFLFKRDRLMQPIKALDRGLNGFPIRMLNGNDFDSRSNLVHNSIYYSPDLGTWALRGIDGGYYIEGDYSKRFIQPLNGVGVGFINTGVGVNGGFLKKIGKAVKKVAAPALTLAKPFASFIPGGSMVTDLASGFLNKKKSVQNSIPSSGGTPAAQPAAAQALTALAPQALSAFAPQLQQSEAAAPSFDNTNVLSALISDKAKQTNSATVLSLQSLDKGLKAKIGDFSNVVGSQVTTLLKQGETLQEVAAKSKDLSTKSLEIIADTQGNSREVLDIMKAEQLKAEQFRTSQSKQSTISLVAIIGLGVVVLFVAFKSSQSSK